MNVENVIGALRSGFRRRILYSLSGGAYRYSELMRSVGVKPEGSGWFAYHLKVLVDAGLVKRQGERYYLSRVGRKAVLLLMEVSRSEESVSVKFLEAMSRMTFIDELKAVWALIILTLSFYPLSIADSSLLAAVIAGCMLTASVLLYISIAISVRSVYVLPILMNISWILVRPERWRWMASIYMLWILSLIAIAYFGKVLYALVLLGVAAALSVTLYYERYRSGGPIRG